MSHQLWATYSVKDHGTPGPLPPISCSSTASCFRCPKRRRSEGYPIGPGPVKRERNAAEWERWEKEHWDPAGQARLLEWLEPVVRRLPWSSEGALHEQYRAEAARLAVTGILAGLRLRSDAHGAHAGPARLCDGRGRDRASLPQRRGDQARSRYSKRARGTAGRHARRSPCMGVLRAGPG